MAINTNEKPCLVQTGRGFSLSYQNRFLYSKYAPDRAINGAIDALTILPGTLLLACSPALWLGLASLAKKLAPDCFILGIEFDKNLHEFAATELEKLKTEDKAGLFKNVALLPLEENEYIVNILSGERSASNFDLPHISTFRRAVPLEMSAGTQFCRENYIKTASLAQNTVASFWKNRITLTNLGRLFSRNLFKNLPALSCAIDFKTLFHTVDCPIFVFGAGESLEETVKNVPKEEIEKCFVIAVDAVSGALKAHGIKVDAIVAVEGQLAIEKAYIGGNAKSSLIVADMTSRMQVTRHTENAVTYIASKYTDSLFFKNLTQKPFFPPTVPPLGSVGLTAVYVALMLRKNINVPVFVSGLDFSFSLGRTHTKNAPAHIQRLSTSDRLHPVENYAAAFRSGAKKLSGKNRIEIITDQALEGYAKSFADVFAGTPNLYDAGKQGLNLCIEQISSEKLGAYLETIGENKDPKIPTHTDKKDEKAEIKDFLEGEEKALNRIKELLMFGNDVASCSMSIEQELHALIRAREYLFLHFPDGYKCATSDLSFLKRIRSQIDFFLKDIKAELKIEN